MESGEHQPPRAPAARAARRSARKRATDWVFARVLAPLLGGLLRLLCATIRWQVEGLEHLAPFWGAGRPLIVACWHGRLVMIPEAWRRHGRGDVFVLMGLNRNGELITRIVERFRMKAIRGGSRDGGRDARAQMEEVVRANPATTLALTPDGPHGPALASKMGVAHVSRSASLPVIWVSAAASRAGRLPTWDRMVVPLPFSRVVVRFSAPLFPEGWANRPLEEYRDGLDHAGRAELERVDAAFLPARLEATGTTGP
ncbi:MAG: DUF374 domain-containing protein [Anaeromyxobacter sp.]